MCNAMRIIKVVVDRFRGSIREYFDLPRLVLIHTLAHTSLLELYLTRTSTVSHISALHAAIQRA
jgi:hypothetical protein